MSALYRLCMCKDTNVHKQTLKLILTDILRTPPQKIKTYYNDGNSADAAATTTTTFTHLLTDTARLLDFAPQQCL